LNIEADLQKENSQKILGDQQAGSDLNQSCRHRSASAQIRTKPDLMFSGQNDNS